METTNQETVYLTVKQDRSILTPEQRMKIWEELSLMSSDNSLKAREEEKSSEQQSELLKLLKEKLKEICSDSKN